MWNTRSRCRIVVVLLLLGCLAVVGGEVSPASCLEIPGELLMRARTERARRPIAEARLRILGRQRSQLLAMPLQNVVDAKKLIAPSGDVHDYTSIGTYWWPNPDTPDRLPYLKKDGVINPDSRNYDNIRLTTLARGVLEMAILYHFTGDEEVVTRAVAQLRSFFLNPETRMNAHLKYAQAVPGVCTGRVWGLIDTYWLIDVVNSVGILRASPALTEEDYRGLQDWFRAYTHWLLTDPMTESDRNRSQNHGLAYQSQVVFFSAFAGDPATARKHLAKFRELIPEAIAENGYLPQEVSRTQSFVYSYFTLDIIVRLASVARGLGEDLLDPATLCGQRIRRAADVLVSYVDHPEKWPYRVLTPVNPAYLGTMLIRMHALTGEAHYRDAYCRLREPKPDRLSEVFFSPSEPMEKP